MTAMCERSWAAPRPLFWLSAAAFLACFAARALAAEAISVTLDEARILKLPDRASTVVIGNPMIADLAIQAGGLAVVTGKAYGATNVIVLDHAGAVLTEKIVEVRGPSDQIVVVYRGVDRATYSCTPLCSPRITLGDEPDYFSKVMNESATRDTQAMAAGAGAK